MTYQRIATAVAATGLLASGLLMAPAAQADDTHRTPAAETQAQAQTEAQAQALKAKRVYLYASNVNLREFPRTSAHVLATKSKIWLLDYCQTDRNTTPVKSPDGTMNRWWSKVTLTSGSDFAWVSNVYLRGGKKIAGVPDC
ncbi:peptidase M23 [Streptomyces sp. NPDC004111]|uniref:peptidase M23 n=1 Tax=Streptomyces sp. NPDC004111 TaxID=3364690 RepID=UPI0036BCCA95